MELPASHMQEREAEKSAAVADIAYALNFIQEQRRDPDVWERVHLIYAFLAVFSGCYGLATAEARNALTPIDQRSPVTRLPNDPVFQCDFAKLIELLGGAQAEPALPFPHFGPVEIRFPAKGSQGKAWIR